MNPGETVRLETAVPLTWIEQLAALARQRGCDVSDLVRQALSEYLQASDRPPALPKELTALQKKVATLERYGSDIQSLSLRLATLERLVIPRTPSPQPIPPSEAIPVLEDEPDEVLVDFLWTRPE
ncbi:MAG: hypothetical protein HC890_01660 [Chloroflexaceae bacterium]|nr:hypothetical protein [Chloroflexaceae bacterium]